MNGIQIIRQILEHATAKGSRSTVLTALMTMSAFLLPATLLSFYINAPSWLGITLTSFLGITILLFLSSYIYFMLTNPDALRSEKYTIQKMAIESGLVGDDIQGLIDIEKELPTEVVPARSIKQIGTDQ